MEKNKKKGKEIHHWGSNKGKDTLPNSTPLKCDREKLETLASPPPLCLPNAALISTLPQTDGEKTVGGHL